MTWMMEACCDFSRLVMERELALRCLEPSGSIYSSMKEFCASLGDTCIGLDLGFALSEY